MALHYLLLIVLLQAVRIECQVFQTEVTDDKLQEQQVINQDETLTHTINAPNSEIPITTNFSHPKKDVLDFFYGSSFIPMSATDIISKVALSEDDPHNKVEELKKTIDKITASMQMELFKLLENAINIANKGKTTEERKERTIETPIDSAKLVMRLLNHIRSHNEHQNIAIEKIMTAQEIAHKYGIEFNPPPEIILDLAAATSEQAENLRKSVNDNENKISNNSKIEEVTVEFVPFQEKNTKETQKNVQGKEYYKYELHQDSNRNKSSSNNAPNLESLILDRKENTAEQYKNQPDSEKAGETYESINLTPQYYYWQPIYEDQLVAQHASPKLNVFYEQPMTPIPDNFIPFAPVMEETTTYIIPPEIHELKPEMVGEEYEETVSSKVFVERGKDSDTSSLDHVTTYSFTEKARFKIPQITHLPQQMEYSFYFI